MEVKEKSAAGRVVAFLRGDPVLAASALGATVSAFFVPPTAAYFGYIDYRVLCLLFCLMLVVAGLRGAGVFGAAVDALLGKVHSRRALAGVLVGACFFSSMLITNDVALITFVPLAILAMETLGTPELLIPVITLQTVAANLGSMLTPMGNPQNLYLYTLSGMGLAAFFRVTALPTVAALVLLVVGLRLLPGSALTASAGVGGPDQPLTARGVLPWCALFGVCLLCVGHLLPATAMTAIVLAAVLLLDRQLLKKVDYHLLLTFVFFFILIGNIKSVPAVRQALSALVAGRELTLGVLLSQIISNVPAAMLLSGFSTSLSALLLGVNLGGLGTLIASMASLISYRQYSALPGARPGRYLAVFTAVNVGFLAVLWPLTAIFVLPLV